MRGSIDPFTNGLLACDHRTTFAEDRGLQALDHQVLLGFLLTLGAGLSTGIGSWLGVLSRRFSPGLLTTALSFSAGVMIFVSFV